MLLARLDDDDEDDLDGRVSCNPCEISSTIWLQYFNRLCFTFHMANIFGCLHARVMTEFKPLNHRFLEQDCATCSPVRFSNHIRIKAMHNLSEH